MIIPLGPILIDLNYEWVSLKSYDDYHYTVFTWVGVIRKEDVSAFCINIGPFQLLIGVV